MDIELKTVIKLLNQLKKTKLNVEQNKRIDYCQRLLTSPKLGLYEFTPSLKKLLKTELTQEQKTIIKNIIMLSTIAKNNIAA